MEMSLVNYCDNEMIGLYDDYFKDETVAGVEQRHDGGVRDAGGLAVGGHP